MIRSLIRQKNSDPSRALDSDIFVPCPDGLAYEPYQRAAVAYAQTRKDILVADDPGIGKTIEGIAIVNFDPNIRRVLVICPAFLKPHWKRSFEMWSTNDLTVAYVKDGKDRSPFICEDVVIINYDLLDKFYDEIRQIHWHVKIIDEVHKLKSKKANRTLQIFGGIRRDGNKKIIARYSPILADKSLYLTGTPSLNGKPKELWNLIRNIDPNDLGADWFTYAKRYCQLQELQRFDAAKGKLVHSGWKWDGADNLEELQTRMRKTFMIRRLKSEVMKDLPPKRRMILPIESGKKLQKELQKDLEEFEKYAKDKGEDAYLEMPSFGDFSKKMKELGLAMVKPAIDVIESDLEEHAKIVVMCWHKEVAKGIQDSLNVKTIRVDGDIAAPERQELVDIFQTDKSYRVFIGTMGSCGEGITLTAASLMIFPERSWMPAVVTQSEDRIHRRGQKESVLIKHLVWERSLAERQIKILIDKQEKSDMMLDRGTL